MKGKVMRIEMTKEDIELIELFDKGEPVAPFSFNEAVAKPSDFEGGGQSGAVNDESEN